MMDQKSAIASSIITVISMGFWYHYTLRIYNRFSWNAKTAWDDEDDDERDMDELDPNSNISKFNRDLSMDESAIKKGIAAQKKMAEERKAQQDHEMKKKKGVKKNMTPSLFSWMKQSANVAVSSDPKSTIDRYVSSRLSKRVNR